MSIWTQGESPSDARIGAEAIHCSPSNNQARALRHEQPWEAVVDVLPLRIVICSPAGTIRALSALARDQFAARLGHGSLVGQDYAALMAADQADPRDAEMLSSSIRSFLAEMFRPGHPVRIETPAALRDFAIFGSHTATGEAIVFYHIDMSQIDESTTDRFIDAAMVMAKDEERKRIGRELHDDICQRLSLVKFNLSKAVQSEIMTPEARYGAVADLAEASEAVGATLDRIRNLTYSLHPPDLEQGDIGQALYYLCRDLRRRTGLEIEFHNLAGTLRRNPGMEGAFYRVAQEATSNVIRHARANSAVVTLRKAVGQLILEVRDDGIGISRSIMSGERSSGLGIWSMHERLHALSGTLWIEPLHGGTKLTAIIPWS